MRCPDAWGIRQDQRCCYRCLVCRLTPAPGTTGCRTGPGPPTSSNPCSDWVMPARLVLVLTREPNLLRLVTQYPWAGQKSRPRTEQGRPVPAVPWWGDTAMVVRAAAAGHAHPGRGGTLSR